MKFKDGHPWAIMAESEGRFKTDTPVAAWLPPVIVKALEEWKANHPNPASNAYILPFRSVKAGNKAIWNKSMQEHKMGRDWIRFQERYNLPYLRPKSMRHWVCTICDDVALMTKNSRCYMMGHDPRSEDRTMGATYNNRAREKAIEEQAALLPNGALATLEEKKVPDNPNRLPSDVESLVLQFISGEMDSSELLPQLLEVRRQTIKAQAPAQQIGAGM